MTLTKFKKLPERMPKNPKVGDLFLDGKDMIAQKIKKDKGDSICYYQVISVKGNNIEYMVRYDKLK